MKTGRSLLVAFRGLFKRNKKASAHASPAPNAIQTDVCELETKKCVPNGKFEVVCTDKKKTADSADGDAESDVDDCQSDANEDSSSVSDVSNLVATRSLSQTPRFPSLKRMSILVSSPQHAQSTIPSSTVQRVNKANHTFTAIKKPAIVISPPSGQLQDKRIASSDQTDQASDEDSPIFQNVRQLALKSDPVPISMLHYRSSDPSNPSTKKPEKSAAPSESDLLHPKHATSSNTAPAIVQPTKSKKISKNKRPVSFAPSTKFQQQPKSALHRIQPWQAAPGYPVVYFQPIPGTAGNSSFQPVYFQPLAPLAPAPVPPMKPKTLINFSNEDYATSGTLKAAAENSRVLRERALEQEVLRARGEIQV